MKIGELAPGRHKPGNDPLLRREGLLQKLERSDGNYRIYSSAHLSRLRFHPALPESGHDAG